MTADGINMIRLVGRGLEWTLDWWLIIPDDDFNECRWLLNVDDDWWWLITTVDCWWLLMMIATLSGWSAEDWTEPCTDDWSLLLMTAEEYRWILMMTDIYWWLLTESIWTGWSAEDWTELWLMTYDYYWWLMMTADNSWCILLTADYINYMNRLVGKRLDWTLQW